MADDDDFGPGDEDFDDDRGYQEMNDTSRSHAVANQPHDEEVALDDSRDFAGDESLPKHAQYDNSLMDDDEMGAGAPVRSDSPPPEAKPGRMAAMASTPQVGDANPSGSGEDLPPGAYNAMDFKHLNVSDEIRELFKYIGRFQAHNIELDTKLKPFIPDYIPSVGSIDEFIKVPRPDGKPDFLGLKVLDEPASKQSDPAVLTLQLRQLTKESAGNKADMVGRIEHSDEKKAAKVQQWISSINEIHKNKPASAVQYSRRMPDIEALMQEWAPEMESFLTQMKMPSGEIDVDLKTLTKLLCSILDIPVYENPIESLHVLFSLYLEFKSNPIFKSQLDMDNQAAAGGPPVEGYATATGNVFSM